MSVQAEREAALRLLGELEATDVATRAQIAETSERIRVLLNGSCVNASARDH